VTDFMHPIVLVQPPARGRISGGFLYNSRLAESTLWELCDLPARELPSLPGRAAQRRLLLMDSIWLTRPHAPSFLALASHGYAIGLMLHSFPSMIEATENGRAPLGEPTSFEREVIEQLDVVVVPGRHYRDLLAGSRTPIVIVEPGIDDAWRAEPRRRSGPCRLVSVGAVTPRKGFLDVAEALDRLARSDFHWTVAGSLEVDAGYAARVSERTLRLPVTLCGQLPPESVRHIVQHADVFLMPSYDENQPLVLLEAMASSVPALAYAAGATRHMLEHETEGFVIGIGDKAALAERLAQLLDDEDLRYRLALSCWQRQRSIRSWAAAALVARMELEHIIGESLEPG
jgi:glycosyltransferase involved in cell wall biosynthesis